MNPELKHLPRIGRAGVFTIALPEPGRKTVLKPINGTVTEAEAQELARKHDAFIGNLRKRGLQIPHTELVIQKLGGGRQLSVRQRLFEEHELATNLIEKGATELALSVAKKVFRTVMSVALQPDLMDSGFHGSLRNFAVTDDEKRQVFFLDTFPPYSSPRELLIHLARYGINRRIQFLAKMALVVPDDVLREHSIFNPVNMVAGLVHSVARRRPEIMPDFTPWIEAEIEKYAPPWKSDLQEKLTRKKWKDPPYRKLLQIIAE